MLENQAYGLRLGSYVYVLSIAHDNHMIRHTKNTISMAEKQNIISSQMIVIIGLIMIGMYNIF